MFPYRTRRTVIALAIAFVACDGCRRAHADPALATVQGRVLSVDGRPIAGAHVLVAVPPGNMRFLKSDSKWLAIPTRRVAEVVTGKDGAYVLTVELNEDTAVASFNAQAAGFCSAAGTESALLNGVFTPYAGRTSGSKTTAVLQHGKSLEISFHLAAGRYVAGHVMDENGMPVSGVIVRASGAGSGATDRTSPDGRFAIFDFPPKTKEMNDPKDPPALSFLHQDFIFKYVGGLDPMSPDQLANLKIKLDRGYGLAGRVHYDDRSGASGVLVEVMYRDGLLRKACYSGEHGDFKIPSGLAAGEVSVVARDLARKQSTNMQLSLNGDRAGLELTMKPVAWPDVKTTTVLGVTIADLTPELNRLYEWPGMAGGGAVIVSVPPGNSWQLWGTKIAAGDVILSVGGRRIKGVSDFVRVAANEVATTKPLANKKYSCLVIVAYRRDNGAGTVGDQLEVDEGQAKSLKHMAARIEESAQ